MPPNVMVPSPGHRFVTEYYNPTLRQIKRVYEVDKKRPTVPDGLFYSLYPDGKLKDIGRYRDGKIDGDWKHYLQSGVLQSEGPYLGGIQQGYWRFYYEGGSKKSEGLLAQNIPSGDWKFFFENGALKQAGAYLAGQPCALWTYYYETGLRKAQANYIEDTAFYREQYEAGTLKAEGKLVNGKSIGTWRYYHPTGKLKAVGTEQDGIKEGKWSYYHHNDSLESSGYYSNGLQTGIWHYYHTNGKLNSKGRLDAGQKQGQWQLFYETGELSGEGNFLDGDGPFTTYYPSGKVKTKGTQTKGLNQGDWLFFAEDGSLEGKCTYSNGKGEYNGFYPDGRKRIVGQLDNGERVGTWSLFDLKGNLVGYYKTFTQAEGPALPTIQNMEPVRQKPMETPKMVKVSQTPWHYRKVVNEQRGFVYAANPLAIFFGSLPVSVEYHWKPRLGFELTGIWLRNRFLNDYAQPDVNITYSQGFSVSIRQKLYFEDEPLLGSFYWAQELRFTQLNHSFASFDLSDTSANRTIVPMSANEMRLELSVIVGTRIFQEVKRKRDVTLDIFGGVGFGFRMHDLPANPNLFDLVDRANYPISLRLGLMIGYMRR